MRKIKYLLIFIASIVATILFYKSIYFKEDVESVREPTKSAINNMHKDLVEIQEKSFAKTPITNNNSRYEEKLPQKSVEYSSEKMIQNAIVSNKYAVCEEYFYQKNFLVSSYKKTFKTDVQNNFYQNSIKNCEQLNKKYPEYGFERSYKQLLAHSKTKGTSRFGQLLERNKELYSNEESLFVFKTIGRDYPELINSPLVYKTLQYHIDITNPDLQRILQTTSINYVNKIIGATENYLACHLGINCGFDSRIMYNYCRREPNFCVNNFTTLFNKRFSDGIRADILLALPYIERLYQVD